MKVPDEPSPGSSLGAPLSNEKPGVVEKPSQGIAPPLPNEKPGIVEEVHFRMKFS